MYLTIIIACLFGLVGAWKINQMWDDIADSERNILIAFCSVFVASFIVGVLEICVCIPVKVFCWFLDRKNA